MEEYNIVKKRRKLIVFDDMIADMVNDKKTTSSSNISLVFITQSYFKVSKDVTLNSIHFFIMKILNKR